MTCRSCGSEFITGSSIKFHCSVQCRLKEIASGFKSSEDCWEWPNSTNAQTGYGQLSEWRDGRRLLHTAHRVSHEAFIGPIPEGQYVLHRCDNPRCFNPAHFFLGGARENALDMVAKGRNHVPNNLGRPRNPASILRGDKHPMWGGNHASQRRGSQHPRAKLTEELVREIRASPESHAALARRLGVSDSAICSARKHGWRHVT